VVGENERPDADEDVGFSRGGHEVTLTSRRDAAWKVRYRTEQRPDGVLLRQVTALDGTKTLTSVRPDGTASVLGPDRVVRETTMDPDARWGMEAPVMSEVRVCYPDACDGPPGEGERRREVSVQTTREQEPDPNDPSLLRSRTERVSVQDGEGRVRTSTKTYLRQDPAHDGVPTQTSRSPLGRRRVVKLVPPDPQCERGPCPADAFQVRRVEVPPWTPEGEQEALPGLLPVKVSRQYAAAGRLESITTEHLEGEQVRRRQVVRFDEEGGVSSVAVGLDEQETQQTRYAYDEGGTVTSQVLSYGGGVERRTDFGNDDGVLTCLSRPRPAGDEDQGNACEGQDDGVLHGLVPDDRGRVRAYDPPDVPGAAAAGEVCGVGPEPPGGEWDQQVVTYDADGRTECTGQAGGAFVAFDWQNLRWPQEVVLGGRTSGTIVSRPDESNPGRLVRVERGNDGWPAEVHVTRHYDGPLVAVLEWAEAPNEELPAPIGEGEGEGEPPNEELPAPIGFVHLGHEPGGFGPSGIGVSGGRAACYGRDMDRLVEAVWLGGDVPVLVDDLGGWEFDEEGNRVRLLVTEELDCGAGVAPTTMTIEHRHAAGLVTGTEIREVSATLEYNGFGELRMHSVERPGASPLFHEEVLERDDRGRIKRWREHPEEATPETVYGYDYAGRLRWVREDEWGVPEDGGPELERVEGVRWVYVYDANGNRRQEGADLDGDGVPESPVVYQYDDQDRLRLRGGTRYVWTPDGSLCRKIPPADGGEPVEEQAGCDEEDVFAGETLYLYDALGNLLQVDLPGGERVEYRVDGMNRRVVRELSHEVQDGERQVDSRLAYVYADNLNPVGLYEGNPDGEPAWRLSQQYVYATRDNVPDLMLKDGRVFRILSDHLGSVRLVVGVDRGEVMQRLRYDAFGRVLEDTNPGFQPFGFAGGLYDPATGLVRFGARDYDPEVGRWTTKDPIGFGGGDTNLYAYVLGDPVNVTDPDGLDIWTEGWCGSDKPLHKKLCVGTPGGKTTCFSFAWQFPSVLRGLPYEDDVCGGSIDRYARTTRLQDYVALALLHGRVADRGMAFADDPTHWWPKNLDDWYGTKNCRSWSDRMFDAFKNRWNLSEGGYLRDQ